MMENERELASNTEKKKEMGKIVWSDCSSGERAVKRVSLFDARMSAHPQYWQKRCYFHWRRKKGRKGEREGTYLVKLPFDKTISLNRSPLAKLSSACMDCSSVCPVRAACPAWTTSQRVGWFGLGWVEASLSYSSFLPLYSFTQEMEISPFFSHFLKISISHKMPRGGEFFFLRFFFSLFLLMFEEKQSNPLFACLSEFPVSFLLPCLLNRTIYIRWHTL